MGVRDGMGHGVGRLAWNVEQLARWWTSATKEERFALLKRTIEAKTQTRDAPTLGEVRLAIYLAEVEAGEVSEG